MIFFASNMYLPTFSKKNQMLKYTLKSIKNFNLLNLSLSKLSELIILEIYILSFYSLKH